MKGDMIMYSLENIHPPPHGGLNEGRHDESCIVWKTYTLLRVSRFLRRLLENSSRQRTIDITSGQDTGFVRQTENTPDAQCIPVSVLL